LIADVARILEFKVSYEVRKHFLVYLNFRELKKEIWIMDLLFLAVDRRESLAEAKQQKETCKQQIEELRRRKSLKLQEV